MRVRCSMFMGKYIVGYWLSEYSILDVGERKINKRYNGYASRVVYLSVAIAGAFWSLRPFWLQRSVYVYRIIFFVGKLWKNFLVFRGVFARLGGGAQGKSRLEVRGDGRTGLASGERYVSLFIGSIRMGKGKKEENFCLRKIKIKIKPNKLN